MFSIETEKQQDVLITRVKGDATIDHAKELQQGLLMAVNEGCDIVLDTNDVAVADISFMQIIDATHKLLMKRKHTISFCNNRVSPAVVNAAKYSGFFTQCRCSANCECRCLMHEMISA
ncbi:MAG: STAS domain-containing protein [Candidatus Omnitrophica bacterium]|nr:STAS domain-containing protein [Candidatus Omnitrophota bacterium]